ncbi:TrmH family RNA methyltransferase [Vallicoccus soli]|uniref:RNA methyltransferase n=1 Tax=Vallicoccus soli TaxID=2339232 RepID=A0A3A3Z0I0_9ACTN|nr:RNA methyltransferase [Vallicoccus soli]RJK96703.1 RNA methyltransferase [Vallicoccus soli]
MRGEAGGVELTSPRSPRVTAARRLHKRAFRSQDRRFLAEGPQAVREALALAPGAPGRPVEVFATAEALARHDDVLGPAAAAGVPVHRASGEVLAALAQTVTPQGVVAVCTLLDVPLGAVLEQRPRLVAVLANVRDPGNAGTVLRAADAAGAEAVVLTDASVDVYNGKCVRASAGSLFHLPVVLGAPLPALVEGLRGAGLRVLAADGAGEQDLDALADRPGAQGLGGPVAWIFGNEAWGLPEESRRLADAVVRVPIHGRAESLNLAAAAAVCLYATARAQRADGGCRAGG